MFRLRWLSSNPDCWMLIRSLETKPEENLRMAYETIACLQDQGLEVFVDFEHAMDAACGRRKAAPCDADMSKRSLDYFNQMVAQCVRQNVSRLVICDTTGGAGPEEVSQVMSCLTWAIPMSNSDFMGTRIAVLELPIREPRFSPVLRRFKAHLSERVNAAAT